MLKFKFRTLMIAALTALVGLLSAFPATALPLFARQTGQNCVACHAGGQFPELTPYGRKFKLTGYTMGERALVPLAVMAVGSMTKVSSTNGSSDIPGDFPRDGLFNFTTASLFCCGKITDNLGLFAQWTYDAYNQKNADTGRWIGKSHVDQAELRYADRFIDSSRDLIIGATLNNNPGVSDVWNTHNSAFTPVPTYVPVANAANVVPFDVPFAPIVQSLGQSTAGVTAYAYWNDTVYAELGTYKTANGIFSLFNESDSAENAFRVKGQNPYWRLALNHDWGAHSAMIGLHGMNAETYFDPADTSSPTLHFRDVGIDGQYQYILDPHAVTAMFSYTKEKQRYADELVSVDYNNASNTLDYLRMKLTYVYQAKYGAALAYTSVKGSADSIFYAANPTNTPDSRLLVPEIFWMPVQYVRVGMQYYKWNQFNGSSSNYDGVSGRNASDNNSLFFYVWGAY